MLPPYQLIKVLTFLKIMRRSEAEGYMWQNASSLRLFKTEVQLQKTMTTKRKEISTNKSKIYWKCTENTKNVFTSLSKDSNIPSIIEKHQ